MSLSMMGNNLSKNVKAFAGLLMQNNACKTSTLLALAPAFSLKISSWEIVPFMNFLPVLSSGGEEKTDIVLRVNCNPCILDVC